MTKALNVDKPERTGQAAIALWAVDPLAVISVWDARGVLPIGQHPSRLSLMRPARHYL